MPMFSEAQSGSDPPGMEVLTLAETAAYLRVPEEAVLGLVDKGSIPAQQIGDEWRFLKRSVVDWLRFGPHFYPEFRMFPPPWMFDSPVWEGLFKALEHRILSKISKEDRPPAKPGSKEAVLKHFGVFQADDDLEEQLAALRAQRKAAGE